MRDANAGSEIADLGYAGGVGRFEVLDASKQVENASEMQFALAG